MYPPARETLPECSSGNRDPVVHKMTLRCSVFPPDRPGIRYKVSGKKVRHRHVLFSHAHPKMVANRKKQHR